MNSAIVQYGQSNIDQYEEQEYKDAIHRFFERNGKSSVIILDSNPRGQKFLAAATAYGIGKGILEVLDVIDEGQTEITRIILKDKHAF